MNKDPYQVLGVSRGSDAETIKKAYHQLVKKYHPDQYTDPNMKNLAQEKMQEINEAYDILSDDQKRQNYDRSGQQTAYDNPFGRGSYGPYQTNGGGSQPSGWGRGYYSPYNNGDGCCDALTGLCIADTCCECMGGDLCACC
ncbi:J domain-containing protein [Oscillospiraceae bacterium HV4-5-C5C]|nr:J domain-containing protein [Oscillospiraceae bacterium HV4-5-C5C]